MNNVLILTVGLPRSGKSTWAKTTGLPIVSPDAIRYAIHGQRYIQQAEAYVWATAHTMIDALFIAGNPMVIFDATNVTHKSRLAWVSERWELRLQPFYATKEVCIQRAISENDSVIIPIIERMAAQWEDINFTELGIMFPSERQT